MEVAASCRRMHELLTLRGMNASGHNGVARGHRDTIAAFGLPGTLARRALLGLLLSIGLVAPAWAGASATRIELLLHGMDCSLCVRGLEQRLSSLPGAQKVLLDLERGRLSLQVRRGSTIADETLRTLMRDAGFVVRAIRRTPVAP